MNASQDPSQLFGFDVTDHAGNTIGKVDNVWVDDATNEIEFVGVKTGWLIGKTHVIPVGDAQISDGTIRVPFGGDTIKHAPSFGEEELTPEQEEEIYSYYGEGGSTTASALDLPADDETILNSGNADTSSDEYAAAGTGTGFTGQSVGSTGEVGASDHQSNNRASNY